MIELMGPMPKKLYQDGTKSKDFFTKKGELRSIEDLDEWPLEDVLKQKYRFPLIDSAQFAAFLTQMLSLDPVTRATAADMMHHPFLDDVRKRFAEQGEKVSFSFFALLMCLCVGAN